MDNTLPEEVLVVTGLALFAAADEADTIVSVDQWQRRADLVETWLDDGGMLSDMVQPKTLDDGTKIGFEFTDDFETFMVAKSLTDTILSDE